MRNELIKKERNWVFSFMIREVNAVYQRANKIGIKIEKKEKFSLDEKEIIKKYYLKERDEIIKRLPHHTLRSIKLCAERMGIHTKKWSKEEIEILKNFYSINLDLCVEQIQKINPRRKLPSIIAKANLLGLIRTNFWALEEDEIIKKYYPVEGPAGVAKRLYGRNEKSIHTRAARLKIKMLPLWSEEDLKILHMYYPIEGGEVIKRLPDKTATQIISKAQALKLKSGSCPRNHSWTHEEDDIIRKYYPTEGAECFYRLEGRTKKSIQGRACILQVKCKKKIMKTEKEN